MEVSHIYVVFRHEAQGTCLLHSKQRTCPRNKCCKWLAHFFPSNPPPKPSDELREALRKRYGFGTSLGQQCCRRKKSSEHLNENLQKMMPKLNFRARTSNKLKPNFHSFPKMSFWRVRATEMQGLAQKQLKFRVCLACTLKYTVSILLFLNYNP